MSCSGSDSSQPPLKSDFRALIPSRCRALNHVPFAALSPALPASSASSLVGRGLKGQFAYKLRSGDRIELHEERRVEAQSHDAAKRLEADESVRRAAAQRLRRLTVKTRLGAEDYEELGLRVTVLDFRPLRVRIEGAISATVDEESIRALEQQSVVESRDDVLTTSSNTVGARSMRPAPCAHHASSASSHTAA